MNVAILSNSYGEDRSGALIARELKALNKNIKIRAFPLISLGEEYKKRNIEVIGGHLPPPSGGFFLKSLKGLFMDIIENAAVPFSYRNRLRKFRKSTDTLIVIGDTPLLVLGYASLRKKSYFLDQCKSTFIAPHLPIERFFMKRLAKLVLTHDGITAGNLQKSGINAEFFGNPMMDDLSEEKNYSPPRKRILIGLLPGSRKEAYNNMEKMAKVVRELCNREKNLHFVVALSETVNKNKITAILHELSDKVDLRYGSFVDIVKSSKIVMSHGGTASEQSLYLGSPVISFPGSGAQNTKRRLKGQKNLLGDAFILLRYEPRKIAEKILEIIRDETLLKKLKSKGKERAGESGGAKKIAEYIYSREKKNERITTEYTEK
jgi:uncharacterized protein (TIGR03492 family)